MAVLYGRAGRLTAKNGGFGPGSGRPTRTSTSAAPTTQPRTTGSGRAGLTCTGEKDTTLAQKLGQLQPSWQLCYTLIGMHGSNSSNLHFLGQPDALLAICQPAGQELPAAQGGSSHRAHGGAGRDKSNCHFRKTATEYDRKPDLKCLSCTVN